MTALLSIAELETRVRVRSLPLAPDDESLDTVRIQCALDDATGIIIAQLPWLIDAQTGDITNPIPAQFASAVKAFCADIAAHRLNDTVSSSEDEREWFKSTMSLISKIDTEYKGGLSGPNLQASCVVVPAEAENIPDGRFFKKHQGLF